MCVHEDFQEAAEQVAALFCFPGGHLVSTRIRLSRHLGCELVYEFNAFIAHWSLPEGCVMCTSTTSDGALEDLRNAILALNLSFPLSEQLKYI